MDARSGVDEVVTGRTVVVTGGSSGIGRALAEEAASRGARSVAIIDRDQAGAADTIARVRANGVRARCYSCDISDVGGLAAVAQSIIADQGVPGLVCANAGVAATFAAVLDESPADVEWLFGVNVFGLVATLRAFGRRMVEAGQPGWLLVTGSEHSLGVPHIGMASYTASKHAVLGYCDVLRRELPDHVGLSVLCPSVVATQLWNAGRNRSDRYGGPIATNDIARSIMARGLDPSVVARVALDGVRDREFLILTHRISAGVARQRADLLSDAAPRSGHPREFELPIPIRSDQG